MASAATWFEVHPLQQLLERDRRRSDGIAQRLSSTLSSLTIARAPSEPVGDLIDALAPDTWIGSGEGTQDFSSVFGSVLPAESAMRGERQRSDSQGSSAGLFEHLEGIRPLAWAAGRKGQGARRRRSTASRAAQRSSSSISA